MKFGAWYTTIPLFEVIAEHPIQALQFSLVVNEESFNLCLSRTQRLSMIVVLSVILMLVEFSGHKMWNEQWMFCLARSFKQWASLGLYMGAMKSQ